MKDEGWGKRGGKGGGVGIPRFGVKRGVSNTRYEMQSCKWILTATDAFSFIEHYKGRPIFTVIHKYRE